MPTWILISDASSATLYAAEKAGADWRLVESLQHPAGRLKSSQLSPSEPGHSAKSKGSPRHTAMEPDVTPKEAEIEHFAEQLAKKLTAGLDHHSYEQVVLVAPPHFLGLLRQRLSAEVAKRLTKAIDKDYTSLSAAELRARLEPIVFGKAGN